MLVNFSLNNPQRVLCDCKLAGNKLKFLMHSLRFQVGQTILQSHLHTLTFPAIGLRCRDATQQLLLAYSKDVFRGIMLIRVLLLCC